jgi:hypothetical protein
MLVALAENTCFSVRIESVCERNTSGKSEFSSWRNAHFVQIELYSQVEEKHVSLERIHPSNHTFQGGEWLILFQKGLLGCIRVAHVSLQRKPSML